MIKYKREAIYADKLILESLPVGYIWNNERFIDALYFKSTEHEIQHYLNNFGNNTNENVNGFNNIIYSIANRSLLKKTIGNKTKKTKTKKWYTTELHNLRNTLINKGKQLKINPNSAAIRHNYFSTLQKEM